MILRIFLIALIGVPSTLAENQKPLSMLELQQYLAGVFADRPESRRCPAPNGSIQDCIPASSCLMHSQCPDGQACCFDGCIFTCLKISEPPPVIDWEVDPSPERIGFMNMTAAGMYSVPVCTTTFQHAPSLPTVCPSGFSCKVQDPGDPLHGTPNRGICVPTEHSVAPIEKNVEDKTNYGEKIGLESIFLPGGCILSKGQYNRIQEFLHRSYVLNCTCVDASIECQLSSAYNSNIGQHKFSRNT